MKILTVVPTRIELNAFLKAFQAQGYHPEPAVTGRLPAAYFPGLETTIALGGLGKTQLALQTQHMIDAGHWDLVICAGAAGALIPGLVRGDVVIATETVEYDTRNKSLPPQLPRFGSSEQILKQCRQEIQTGSAFRLHYGPIASGDEFFMTGGRRAKIQKHTGALVVAMEGAGAARACQINGVPFIEIRAVTDKANIMSLFDFLLYLKKAMNHVAQVVIALACYHLEANRAG